MKNLFKDGPSATGGGARLHEKRLVQIPQEILVKIRRTWMVPLLFSVVSLEDKMKVAGSKSLRNCENMVSNQIKCRCTRLKILHICNQLVIMWH